MWPRSGIAPRPKRSVGRGANLVTLCPYHHDLVHEGILIIQVDMDGKVAAVRRDGSPLKVQGPPALLLEGAPEDCPLTLTEPAPRGAPAETAAAPRGAQSPRRPGLRC